MYDQAEISGMVGDKASTAHWIDPSAPENGWSLYPEELLGLLSNDHA
jgi:hypothetical protein